MKFTTIYVIIYLVVLGYASLCDAVVDEDLKILDKAYIIQYEPSLTSGIILDRIRDAGINYTHRFNLDYIDSVSIKLHLKEDVNRFSQISGIESIYPVTIMKPRLFTAHKITGVDVLQKETGLNGTGVKIGVIDSGLDYRHSAFGNCFKTPGCKTQFGTDLIGDSGDIHNLMPDNDPLETCSGHGTHVTGIIAADDYEVGFSGVAPGATLGIYRAIDCNTETTNDLVIQALQLADKDGMDIINISLGGRFRAWSDTPLGNAINAMVAKGILIFVASSSNGQNGLFAAGDPDSASKAITVGEVDNLRFLAFVANLSSKPSRQIPYITTALTTRYLLPGPLPIVIANETANLPDNDGCTPYTNQNFTNKIALIRRGGCSFDIKNQFAAKAGAVGTMFYNNDTSLVVPVLLSTVFPSGILSNVEGEFVKKEIRKYPGVTISFPADVISVPHQNADRPSEDSSWGPTFELDIKPEILAPGGRIFSTFPLNLGKYASLSGTSMSSAYASGTAALYLEATGLRKGTVDPIKIKNLFIHTATPYCNSTDDKLLLSVDKQGGGLINIKEALKTKVMITPSKLLLNDSAHFDGYKTITLTNLGKKTTKYTIDHLHSPTVRGFFADLWIDTRLFVYEKKFAKVKFSTNCVIVRPGKTVKIKVKFTEPRNIPNDFGVYSGYISIKDSTYETVSTIPYLGVKGDLKNKLPVLLRQNIYKPSNPDVVFTRQDQVVNVTFIGFDVPLFSYFLNYGSRFIKMELYKRGDFTTSGFVGFPIFVTDIPNPDIQAPRNGDGFPNDLTVKPWASGQVSTTIGGTPINVPNGQYQALLYVLKPFGNPNNYKDFITWKSPVIQIIDPPPAAANQTTTTTTTTT